MKRKSIYFTLLFFFIGASLAYAQNTLQKAEIQDSDQISKNLIKCRSEMNKLEKEQSAIKLKYYQAALGKEPFTPTEEYPTGEDFCRTECAGIGSEYNVAIDKIYSKKESELSENEKFIKNNCEKDEDKRASCNGKDCCKVLSYIADTNYMLKDDQGKVQLGKYDFQMVDGVGGNCGIIYSHFARNESGKRVHFYNSLISEESRKIVEGCPWVKKRVKVLDLYDSIEDYYAKIEAKENECMDIEDNLSGCPSCELQKVITPKGSGNSDKVITDPTPSKKITGPTDNSSTPKKTPEGTTPK